MAATATSASSPVTLFPELPSGRKRRPAHTKEPHVRGTGRATPGNRRSMNTTITLTPLVEELFERLIESGRGDSNSDVARKAVVAMAIEAFGEDFVRQLEAELDGKETRNA